MLRFLYILVFGLYSCATLPQAERSHPYFSDLALDVKTSLERAWPDILAADIVLIGELHDNPDHHIIQANLIRALAASQRLDAVFFEHLDTDQAPLLLDLKEEDLDRLPEILNWENSGWPDFLLYRPIFKEVLRAKVSIVAANFPRRSTMEIYKTGYASLFNAGEIEALGLQDAFAPEIENALRQEIFEGHCKMIPEAHIGPMMNVQRARDAMTALQYQKLQSRRNTSVYIVGAGHARKDFGIPWYLRRLKADVKIYSIALKESSDNLTSIASEPFDLVLTTKPVIREDPCTDLRNHLKNRD